MAYGVISASVLLSFGYSPALSSASVHAAKVFTTLTSGASHLKFGNVDKRLVMRLVYTGVIFGALGAFVCTKAPGEILTPFVAAYLAATGVIILIRIFRPIRLHISEGRIPITGSVAAFFDAMGGGGWGPISTSTLMAGGHNPRLTIGSVNLAGFAVAVAETLVFFTFLGLRHADLVIGLTVGGVAVAPLAAYLCKKMPTKLLMLIAGALIMCLSIKTIFYSL